MRQAFCVVLLILTLFACPTEGRVSVLSASATLSQVQDRGNPDIKVWVDTAYGYYHCPGTKWYGATRQGVYMTQRQAQDRNYRPASTVCR